jgi:hypothetical protein
MSAIQTLRVHECQCPSCAEGLASEEKEWHQHINLLMSRLDEQQRRWLAGAEATRLGHGGTKRLSQITGLHVNTIRRGRRELCTNLEQRPMERVRMKGGGRKALEKKARIAQAA